MKFDAADRPRLEKNDSFEESEESDAVLPRVSPLDISSAQFQRELDRLIELNPHWQPSSLSAPHWTLNSAKETTGLDESRRFLKHGLFRARAWVAGVFRSR